MKHKTDENLNARNPGVGEASSMMSIPCNARARSDVRLINDIAELGEMAGA